MFKYLLTACIILSIFNGFSLLRQSPVRCNDELVLMPDQEKYEYYKVLPDSDMVTVVPNMQIDGEQDGGINMFTQDFGGKKIVI